MAIIIFHTVPTRRTEDVSGVVRSTNSESAPKVSRTQQERIHIVLCKDVQDLLVTIIQKTVLRRSLTEGTMMTWVHLG